MIDYTKQISDSLVFRKARIDDVPEVGVILRDAVERMLAEGKLQWDKSYPNDTHVRSDIDHGVGYVMEIDGTVIAYAAVVFTGEPAYDTIDGEWLTDGKYVVVHRLAVSKSMKRQGIGRTFLTVVADYARSLGIHSFRIDTNFDNDAMLGLLPTLGFSYCGEIKYEKGCRKAFEKII